MRNFGEIGSLLEEERTSINERMKESQLASTIVVGFAYDEKPPKTEFSDQRSVKIRVFRIIWNPVSSKTHYPPHPLLCRPHERARICVQPSGGGGPEFWGEHLGQVRVKPMKLNTLWIVWE